MNFGVSKSTLPYKKQLKMLKLDDDTRLLERDSSDRKELTHKNQKKKKTGRNQMRVEQSLISTRTVDETHDFMNTLQSMQQPFPMTNSMKNEDYVTAVELELER